MKLAVSNVAWYPKQIDGFIRLLQDLQVHGLEFAPSMEWDEPADVPFAERKGFRDKIEAAGLRIIGLQALLYTRQDLKLFESQAKRIEVLEYCKKLMELCYDLGGEVLVFGSPRNRSLNGLAKDAAWDISVEFFRKIGKAATDVGVYFCIEPLEQTVTDFINSVAEAEKLIRDAGSPSGLGLHIDTKGLIEENEVEASYLSESIKHAKHIHLNDPGLMPPGSTGYDHRAISKIIAGSGYDRFASIEMRRQEPDISHAIIRAVEYVKSVYNFK